VQNNNVDDDQPEGDLLEEILDQVEMENQEDYDFQSIVDHNFDDGQLMMKIEYWDT